MIKLITTCLILFIIGSLKSQGLKIDFDLYQQIYAAPPVSKIRTISPASASLRDYCPTILKQMYSDCVPQAVTLALGIAKNVEKKSDNTQKDEGRLSPLFLYELCIPEGACNTHLYFENVFCKIKETGADLHEKWKARSCWESPESVEGSFERAKQAKNAVNGIGRLNGATNAIDQVRNYIANGSPVLYGRPVPWGAEEFFRKNPKITNWKFSDYKKATELHAMVITGYDDRTQQFEIANSYGADWGDRGFFYMSYQELACDSCVMYVMGKDDPCNPGLYRSGKDENMPMKMEGLFEFQLKEEGPAPVELNQKATRDFTMSPAQHDFTYRLKGGIRSEQEFKLYVQVGHPCYVYMLNFGTSGNIQLLYPIPKELTDEVDYHFSPYFPFPNTAIALPLHDTYFKPDEHKGVEYFCILYSTAPIDIDKMVGNIRTANKGLSLTSKLRAATDVKMIEKKYLRFSSQNIGFETIEAQSGFVPLIIAIDHQ